MTQEDKKLLIKDLCARLPYGVICNDSQHGNSKITEIDTVIENVYCNDFYEYVDIKNCKPYLRPMSSMTEEEENEWKGLNINPLLEAVRQQHRIDDSMLRAKSQYKPLDYLNANHFDYRGLIPMGLAIAITEENNPYKK